MRKKLLLSISLMLISAFVLFAKFDPETCVWQYLPEDNKLHVQTGTCYFNNYCPGAPIEWIYAGTTYECSTFPGTCYAVDCLEYHPLCEFVPYN